MALATADHPTFREFKPWFGRVKAGFDVNFVGQLTDVRFHKGWDTPDRMQDRDVWPPIFEAGEETFEWLLLLNAVLEAKDSLTVVELGAGYGRWMVSAACAARLRRPDLQVKLVGVEAQPDHFRWMLQHLADNGFDGADHRLINAAVAREPGTIYLVDDDPTAWYGQYITRDAATTDPYYAASKARPVAAVTLAQAIEGLDFVDLLDMDIQDAEVEVVPASIRLMTERVRRVFVEIHSEAARKACMSAFSGAGWQPLQIYDGPAVHETEFGPVHFTAGVQTWLNPRAGRQPTRWQKLKSWLKPDYRA
jgi:FkbM family methyltransferase